MCKNSHLYSDIQYQNPSKITKSRDNARNSSFYGIIIYPIISITLSVFALASGEKKAPAILGLILSIIGGVGLILFCVFMYALSGMW